jgi:hypothetical protein
MTITSTEYAAEMRRIEKMRNEAHHLGDSLAVAALTIRATDLNGVFWRPMLKRA